jgi:hypothetical protein
MYTPFLRRTLVYVNTQAVIKKLWLARTYMMVNEIISRRIMRLSYTPAWDTAYIGSCIHIHKYTFQGCTTYQLRVAHRHKDNYYSMLIRSAIQSGTTSPQQRYAVIEKRYQLVYAGEAYLPLLPNFLSMGRQHN